MKRVLLLVALASLAAWVAWNWGNLPGAVKSLPKIGQNPATPGPASQKPMDADASTPDPLSTPSPEATPVPTPVLPMPALPSAPTPTPAPPLPEGVRIDRIHVRKAAREMTVYASGFALKTYRVALGGSPVGHKQFEGDNRTPEGRYTISGRNPNSRYHLSLRISYPNAADRAFAAKMKRPPGGDIMIHGLPNGYVLNGPVASLGDWTIGCVAVTNEEIEELWRAVPDGCEVELSP